MLELIFGEIFLLVLEVIAATVLFWTCVLVLAALVNLYFRFKNSKFYEQFIILKRERNGDITAVEGEVGPDGSIKERDKKTIPQSDVNKNLNDKLDEALASGSTIDGKAALLVEPTEKYRDELNDRVRRGK